MTVLHVTMNGQPLRISVDDGLIVQVAEGKIDVHQRPKAWRPPSGERIEAKREGNLFHFPLMILEPSPNDAA